MSRTTIDRLVINSPYTEPSLHWRYERETRDFPQTRGSAARGARRVPARRLGVSRHWCGPAVVR